MHIIAYFETYLHVSDFICRYDPRKRITAAQALEHECVLDFSFTLVVSCLPNLFNSYCIQFVSKRWFELNDGLCLPGSWNSFTVIHVSRALLGYLTYNLQDHLLIQSFWVDDLRPATLFYIRESLCIIPFQVLLLSGNARLEKHF